MTIIPLMTVGCVFSTVPLRAARMLVHFSACASGVRAQKKPRL